jgi:hypothetical protein
VFRLSRPEKAHRGGLRDGLAARRQTVAGLSYTLSPLSFDASYGWSVEQGVPASSRHAGCPAGHRVTAGNADDHGLVQGGDPK